MKIIRSENSVVKMLKPKKEFSKSAPKRLGLSLPARKIYSELVEKIGESLKLERLHEEVLGMLAEEIYTWVWANEAIQKKNKTLMGAGYIQTFKTGATNITTEMAVRNTALKNIANLSKKFGLTVRDLKEIGEVGDQNQLSFLDELLKNTAS